MRTMLQDSPPPTQEKENNSKDPDPKKKNDIIGEPRRLPGLPAHPGHQYLNIWPDLKLLKFASHILSDQDTMPHRPLFTATRWGNELGPRPSHMIAHRGYDTLEQRSGKTH